MRDGHLHTGQYLYGERLGFQIKGVEMFRSLNRHLLPTDDVGIMVGDLPKELFAEGDVFTTEKPFCNYCEIHGPDVAEDGEILCT